MLPKRQSLKWFGRLSLLLLVILSTASCASTGVAAQLNDGKITLCHATGDVAAPYEKLTLNFDELAAHARHRNDLIPPPGEECPPEVQIGGNTGKIAICHATGSLTNPYNEITIDFNGLNGHANHLGDIIPAPLDGCPSVTPSPGPSETPTMTPTPTSTATPTATAAASATPTLTATATGNGNGMITICHATGSAKNPYVMITISINGLSGHSNHSGDIIPAPSGGCPKK